MIEDWQLPRGITLLPPLLRWCSGSTEFRLQHEYKKYFFVQRTTTKLILSSVQCLMSPTTWFESLSAPTKVWTENLRILWLSYLNANDPIGVAPVQRLPDLGLGPASHLRTGSVMDILGIKHIFLFVLLYLTSPSFSGKKSWGIWIGGLWWCLSINYEMVLSRKRWFPPSTTCD